MISLNTFNKIGKLSRIIEEREEEESLSDEQGKFNELINYEDKGYEVVGIKDPDSDNWYFSIKH